MFPAGKQKNQKPIPVMFIQKELWKIALPLVSLIFLFLIIPPVQAILYNQDGFLLHGSPEEGWIFITPEVDYFAMWLGEDLGSIWIYKQTGFSECLMIRKGNPETCEIKELSILMHYFPIQLIEELKASVK